MIITLISVNLTFNIHFIRIVHRCLLNHSITYTWSLFCDWKLLQEPGKGRQS